MGQRLVAIGALLVEAVFEQMSPLIFGSEACCQKCTPWENGDMAISTGPQYGPVRLKAECAAVPPPPDGSRGSTRSRRDRGDPGASGWAAIAARARAPAISDPARDRLSSYYDKAKKLIDGNRHVLHERTAARPP